MDSVHADTCIGVRSFWEKDKESKDLRSFRKIKKKDNTGIFFMVTICSNNGHRETVPLKIIAINSLRDKVRCPRPVHYFITYVRIEVFSL